MALGLQRGVNSISLQFDGTPNYVSWPALVKIGRCEVVERSSGLPYKKTPAPRDSSQPPFSPEWADRAQNSLNAVIPWHVYVYRIGCTLPDLFRKDWFFGPKSNYIIGFQPTISISVDIMVIIIPRLLTDQLMPLAVDTSAGGKEPTCLSLYHRTTVH